MGQDDTREINRRSVLRLTGAGVVLLTCGTGTTLADESEMQTAAKEHVAEQTGADPSTLRVVNESVATYEALDERYYNAKVRNTETRETHAVTLDGTTRAVDRERIRQRSRRAYRDQYGKLDRELAARVETASGDDRLPVDVWLNGIDRNAARTAVGLSDRGTDPEAKTEVKAEFKRRVQVRTAKLADAMDRMPDVTVEERGEVSPRVTARATPAAIDRLQRRADVWKVLNRDGDSGDTLASASRTHDSYSERNGRYDASGYSVGIFEYSGYPRNTYINRAATFPNDSNSARAEHEHVVSMCAAGTDDDEPGIASEADVYCAQEPGDRLEKKVQWFDDQDVTAVNFSFYFNANSKRTMTSTDFQWDQWVANSYMNIVKSAGNQSSTSDLITTTPAKGFNTLSVGATSDKGSGSNTSDDETAYYSCWKNPRSENDNPSSDYYPHQKPEVSAVGTSIDTPPYGATSGTSFTAPPSRG